jgi:hypothetical protein
LLKEQDCKISYLIVQAVCYVVKKSKDKRRDINNILFNKGVVLMASMNFQVITINLTNGPDSFGTCSGSGSVAFSTNVLKAEGALYSWKVSYGGGDNHVRTAGAAIDNVQVNGSTVTVEGSLTLIDDSDNKINVASSKLQIVVMAWVE